MTLKPASSRCALCCWHALSPILTRFAQKHHDALFAPEPEASPEVLAQAGVFLALRDLDTATNSGARGPWSSPALAGYRVGSSPSTFQHSVTFTTADDRTAKVSVGSPAFGSTELPVEVVDFDGRATSFPAVRPIASLTEAGGASMTALLGDHMSQVDIVAHADHVVGKETLNLFSTREKFVGQVEVRPPKWLEAIRGEKKAAPGSAKAPMRESIS